ncbi:hypothetical protein Tco_0088616 [Tanacetum coccineum]
MVAFLKKPEGSAGFHQIVDFLNSTHIKYALTENPTIYVSLIHQFWKTASASTSENGEMEITATIDRRVKTVTKASIRRHLKLEDSNGISTLHNTEIFEQLAHMGSLQIFLNKHKRQLLPHKRTYIAPTLTQKLFGNIRRIYKGYNGVDIPLFPTMLVQGPIFQGEGSTVPETEVPQLSSPPHTNVADEAASTGVDVRHGGVATTVTSLDAGQGSGNINKTPSMPHDLPFPRDHTLRSDDGRMQQNELMDLVTKLSDRCEALETNFRQTKKVYSDAFTRLIKKVKKFEKIVKTSQAKRRSRVVISDDKEELEDPSKPGRNQLEDHLRVLSAAKVLVDAARKRREVVNVQSYTRRRRAVSTGSGEISTAEESVSTAGTSMPVSTVGMVQEASTPSLVATKDKSKAIMQESESLKKMKQREQIQISRDEEVVLKLQEEFDAAERHRIAKVHEEASSFNIE